MLVKQESLRNYFHCFLLKGLYKQNIHAQDDTISYLTNLLVTFSRSETFIDQNQGRATHKPLAFYYSEAINSKSIYERDIAMRRLGDIALFICGLFSKSLSKKAVNIDYYVAMGGTAYSYLSEKNHDHIQTKNNKNVFYELSNKFVDFVDILSDLNKNQSDKNLLHVYETWLRTHSKKAKRILIENQILPIEHSINLQ